MIVLGRLLCTFILGMRCWPVSGGIMARLLIFGSLSRSFSRKRSTFDLMQFHCFPLFASNLTEFSSDILQMLEYQNSRQISASSQKHFTLNLNIVSK